MLSRPGHLIGDAWFFPHEGRVHAYFLTCVAGLARHEHWDIGHATSGDLMNWDHHGVGLRGGGAGAWDRNLATGSVLRRGGRFWMAYTGHASQQVGVAVSDDLHAWEKLPENPVTGIDPRFYEPVGSGSRRLPHRVASGNTLWPKRQREEPLPRRAKPGAVAPGCSPTRAAASPAERRPAGFQTRPDATPSSLSTRGGSSWPCVRAGATARRPAAARSAWR